MTGGKVLPAIQVDLIGQSLQNNAIRMQYVMLRDRHTRFTRSITSASLPSAAEVSSARKCLFGPSDPIETQKLYAECVENGRQRLINNYDFDILTEQFCENTANNYYTQNDDDGDDNGRRRCGSIECVDDDSNVDIIDDTITSNIIQNDENSVQLVNDNRVENYDNTIVQNARLHQEFHEILDQQQQQYNQQRAISFIKPSDKMCNDKIDGRIARQQHQRGNRMKRSYPFTKITDYFPKIKIASTKKA